LEVSYHFIKNTKIKNNKTVKITTLKLIKIFENLNKLLLTLDSEISKNIMNSYGDIIKKNINYKNLITAEEIIQPKMLNAFGIEYLLTLIKTYEFVMNMINKNIKHQNKKIIKLKNFTINIKNSLTDIENNVILPFSGGTLKTKLNIINNELKNTIDDYNKIKKLLSIFSINIEYLDNISKNVIKNKKIINKNSNMLLQLSDLSKITKSKKNNVNEMSDIIKYEKNINKITLLFTNQ
jgi:hypothetical protein